MTPYSGSAGAHLVTWKYTSSAMIGFRWNQTKTYNVFGDYYMDGCRSDGVGAPMNVPSSNGKALIIVRTTQRCTWETIIRNARFNGFDLVVVKTLNSDSAVLVSYLFSTLKVWS